MKKILSIGFVALAFVLLITQNGDVNKTTKTQVLMSGNFLERSFPATTTTEEPTVDAEQTPEEPAPEEPAPEEPAPDPEPKVTTSRYTLAERYRYEILDQGSQVIYSEPDEEIDFEVTIKNTGKYIWSLDSNDQNKLVLGTYYPSGRESLMYDEDEDEWLDSTKITIEDEDDKDEIQPNETLTFEFTGLAPEAPGVYREEFLPLLSGIKWLNNTKLTWDIVVGGDFNETYDFELANQNQDQDQDQNQLSLTSASNKTKEITLTLENTGETPWYNDGPFSTQLKVTDIDTEQTFGLTTASIATTYEKTVAPGETGTFHLNITTPETPGTYTLPLTLSIPTLLELDDKPINIEVTVSDKLVALTFDDGYGDIDAFLEVLNEENVKATFFMLGVVAQNNPEAMKRIVEEGHLLACHSYDHPDFRGLSASSIRWQMQACRDAIISATDGYDPYPYFRYPYGAHNSATDAVLSADGWQWYHWTNGTGDFNYHASSPAGRSHILYYSTLNPPAHANVLMHIISRSSLAVLPDIIARYKDMGYALVTVDEL